MSPAEARRKENLPYVEGLEYFNKPLNMGTAAGAGPAGVDGADQSSQLRVRIAEYLLRSEEKALAAGATTYDGKYAGRVSALTGGDFGAAMEYVNHRRDDNNRFTTEARTAALNALVALCGGNNA